VLNDADVLFSLLHDNSSFFTEVHLNMIRACVKSPRCKRFVPSEYGGDIERFPQHPEFYLPTHGPVRAELLRRKHELEFTFFNLGWFMDYFVPSSASYMKNLGVVWPLDIEHKRIRVPGTGDEKVSFTAARDVAKALVKLVDAGEWVLPSLSTKSA
jgi:nucleoside-diphosphate-sugar epimerase